MVIDYVIVAGLILISYMNWRTYQDVTEIGEVVASMLIDLGKQGILKVEVEDDDS